MDRTNLISLAAGALLAGVIGTPALAQQQSAPAYLVVELAVANPEGFSEYGEKVGATLEQYDGTVIVGGVPAETTEGDAPQGSVIIVRFDSLADAKEWMNSPEYSAIRPIRQQNATTHAYLVEGTKPQ